MRDQPFLDPVERHERALRSTMSGLRGRVQSERPFAPKRAFSFERAATVAPVLDYDGDSLTDGSGWADLGSYGADLIGDTDYMTVGTLNGEPCLEFTDYGSIGASDLPERTSDLITLMLVGDMVMVELPMGATFADRVILGGAPDYWMFWGSSSGDHNDKPEGYVTAGADSVDALSPTARTAGAHIYTVTWDGADLVVKIDDVTVVTQGGSKPGLAAWSDIVFEGLPGSKWAGVRVWDSVLSDAAQTVQYGTWAAKYV